jgi:hypothetical protein
MSLKNASAWHKSNKPTYQETHLTHLQNEIPKQT